MRGVLILGLLCLAIEPATAQVITDGTLGSARSLAGPDYAVTQDLGQIRGDNLFHSFSRFDIGTGESATFSGPAAIRNIISRVTGGDPSDIDGTLRSTIPDADFFMINPAGVVFGPNASLDVDGSFHVSTADEITFPDGVFSATDPASSILTTAAPEAFGFLNENPASILVDRSDLTLPEGETLSIVGGDITIQGEGGDFSGDPADSPLTAYEYLIPLVKRFVEVDAKLIDLARQLFEEQGKESPNEEIIDEIIEQQNSLEEEIASEIFPKVSKFDSDFVDEEIPKIRSFLQIPSGDVRLISVASPGAVPIVGPLERADFNGFGNILVDGVFTTLDGDADRMTPGGSFYVDGGNVVYKDSHVTSISYGDLDGGDITFIADDLTLTAERERLLAFFRYPLATPTSLFTETDGTGRGGDITFAADTITFDGGIGVFTDTFGSGTSGDITITGRDVAIRFSTSIGAFVEGSSSSGGSGDVTVTADSLLIAADGAVRITGLTSSTSGAGDAGDVLVQAKSVVLDGLQNLEFERGGAGLFQNVGLHRAGVASGSSGSGAAGDVTVIADSVSVLGNAIIESATSGAGAGGTVTIKAQAIEIREGGRFFAGTGGAGDAGSIVVEADRLSLSNDTSPFFSSLGTNSFGSAQLVRGNAGDIIVNVGTLELLTGGVLRATIAAPAKGGDVLITADRVVISGDGTVFPIDEFTPFRPSPGNFTGIVSSGVDITSGDAGNITINAGSIEIGGGAVIASTIEGVGSGGAITLNSGVLTMTEGARLDASTFGPGAGGNIVVNVTDDALMNGESGGFFVESFSTKPDAGLAGSIFVTANTLSVENKAQISTNSAVADGGNIDIQVTELVFVSESSITTSVGDGSGAGGNILIDPQFVVLNDARIQANAFGGPGGNILIVASNFVASPDSVVEASSQLGIDGDVTIDASQRDLVGQVVVLPDELLDATQQLAEQCSARGGKTLATFVGRGRSGLPQQPGGVIFAEYGDGDHAASGSRGSMQQPGRLQISCSQ